MQPELKGNQLNVAGTQLINSLTATNNHQKITLPFKIQS